MELNFKSRMNLKYEMEIKREEGCFNYFNPKTVKEKVWTLRHFTNVMIL